jgi:ribonuclease D
VGQGKNNTATLVPEYDFIETPKALAAFLDAIESADMVAVDTEGDSMFHYKERLCLIQVSANGYTAVIDPLSIGDLSSLKPLFRNRRVCKVFHGADYDVRSLYRDFDIVIHNLFDTQLASVFLGWKETSLEAVVHQRFGVELDKKYQKKNWSRRPLPEEMSAYAAADVTHLIPLARILMTELEQLGRLDWVVEECRLLSGVRPQEEEDGPMFLKFKGAGRLEPRQLAALEALLQMRNAIARQKDRPHFKIISNVALKKIAVAMPTDLTRLKSSGILSGKQFDMYGRAVMEAIRNASQIPKSKLPVYPRRKSPRLSRGVPERVKALREWRDETAARLELDPALVLNRALIRAIAVENPTRKATLGSIDGLHQWQANSFGGDILRILRNGNNP